MLLATAEPHEPSPKVAARHRNQRVYLDADLRQSGQDGRLWRHRARGLALSRPGVGAGGPEAPEERDGRPNARPQGAAVAEPRRPQASGGHRIRQLVHQ